MSFGRKGRCFQSAGAERRRSARQNVSLTGSLQTPASSEPVLLKDISATGARLTGRRLPDVGEFVRLHVERSTTFGTMLWRKGEDCGLRFDGMLSQPELDIFTSNGGEGDELDLRSWAMNMRNHRIAQS